MTPSGSSAGNLSISVTGDLSELLSALQQAQNAAQQAGDSIAQALSTEGTGGLADLSAQLDQTASSLETVTGAAKDTGAQIDSLTGCAADATSAASEVAASTTDMSSAMDQAATASHDAASALDSVATSGGDAAAGSTAAGEAASAAGSAADEAESGFAGLGEELLKIAEIAGIGLGFAELASEAIKSVAAVQDLTTSLTYMTGSAAKAAEDVDTLKQMALGLSEPFSEVAATAQKMTAQLGSFDTAIPLMQLAADSSHVMGTSFEGAANSIDRMVLSGMAGARQLVSLGISANDLADAMGVTTTEVTKAFKALDQSDRIAVLEAALSKFSGASQQFAQNIGEQWTNFETQFEFDLEAAGMAFVPFLSNLETGLGDILKAIQPVTEAIAGFVASAVTANIEDVSSAIRALSSAFGDVKSALAPLSPMFSEIADVFERITGSNIGDFFSSLAQKFVGYITGLGQLKDILTLAAATMEYVTGKAASFDAAILAVTSSENQMIAPSKAVADAVQAQGIAHDSAAAAAGRHTAAHKALKDSMDAVTAASATLTQNLDTAQKTFDQVSADYAAGKATIVEYGTAITNLEAAQKAYNDAAQVGLDKNKTVVDGLADLVNAAAKGEISWDELSAKIKAASGDDTEFVQCLNDGATAMVKVNGTQQLLTKGITDFTVSAQAAGVTILNYGAGTDALGTKATGTSKDFKTAGDTITTVVVTITDGLDKVAKAIDAVAGEAGKLDTSTVDVTTSTDDATKSFSGMGDAIKGVTNQTQYSSGATNDLTSALNDLGVTVAPSGALLVGLSQAKTDTQADADAAREAADANNMFADSLGNVSSKSGRGGGGGGGGGGMSSFEIYAQMFASGLASLNGAMLTSTLDAIAMASGLVVVGQAAYETAAAWKAQNAQIDANSKAAESLLTQLEGFGLSAQGAQKELNNLEQEAGRTGKSLSDLVTDFGNSLTHAATAISSVTSAVQSTAPVMIALSTATSATTTTVQSLASNVSATAPPLATLATVAQNASTALQTVTPAAAAFTGAVGQMAAVVAQLITVTPGGAAMTGQLGVTTGVNPGNLFTPITPGGSGPTGGPLFQGNQPGSALWNPSMSAPTSFSGAMGGQPIIINIQTVNAQSATSFVQQLRNNVGLKI